MEEDIKVLEEILNRQIEDTEGTKIMKQAIENLIKGYKELEQQVDLEWVENNYIEKAKYDEIIKRNKDLEECLKAEEKYAEGLNNDIKSLLNIEPNDNFIPKSKVKAEIHDIDNWLDNGRYFGYGLDPHKLTAQKEILEKLL